MKRETKLYLIKDEVTPVAYLIDYLYEICEQNEFQAQQNIIIAANKGRAHIATGTLYEMIALQEEFSEYGVTTEIKNEFK